MDIFSWKSVLVKCSVEEYTLFKGGAVAAADACWSVPSVLLYKLVLTAAMILIEISLFSR